MLVKCIDTGEKIDRDKAYKININGKNKYYSSKEGYDAFVTNNYYRNKSIDLIREVMGYSLPQMQLPTLTYKKVKEYEEPIGLDVLYETLLDKKRDIEYAFYNKTFNSETAKIMYLFAIVQNHYMKFWRKKVAVNKEKAINKSETSEEIDTEWESTERRKSVKDLSNFLDDED